MANCSELIQFDTVQTSNNLVEFLAMSKFIREENYELAKTNASADVMEYFSGDYEQFTEKVKKLEEKFNLSGFRNVQNNYYHHILSPVGAKAYAECIRQTSNKQLSAWIEAKSENTITIGVRNGLAGNTSVKYRVVGAKPKNRPTILNSQSEEHLLFDYTSDSDFSIVLTSFEIHTNAKDSVSILIPKTRRFEIKKESKTLETYIDMGAGCQGDTSKCAFCKEGYLVADIDFKLLPESLLKTGEKLIGGKGVRDCKIEWHKEIINGEVKRMIGYAHYIDGNDGDTQSSSRYFYTITQVREYVVENS